MFVAEPTMRIINCCNVDYQNYITVLMLNKCQVVYDVIVTNCVLKMYVICSEIFSCQLVLYLLCACKFINIMSVARCSKCKFYDWLFNYQEIFKGLDLNILYVMF